MFPLAACRGKTILHPDTTPDGANDVILLESGSGLLLESGSYILIES